MKYFKKSDLLIILLIIVGSIIFFILYRSVNTNKPAKAEIYYNSKLVMTVPLDTGVGKTFAIPQEEHVTFHLYKDGSIRFEQSDCPDKICVNTGKIHLIGEQAVCLPNRIVLKIVPKNNKNDDDDLDIIAQVEDINIIGELNG